MKKYYGEEFINKIYTDLFESDIVKRSGKGSNKNEDVALYFDRLERISRKASKIIGRTEIGSFEKKKTETYWRS